MATLHNLLYRVGQRLRGWDVLQRIQQLNEMEEWPPERLAAFRLGCLRRVVHHAYQNVPLYRRLWDESAVHPSQVLTLADLSEFPKVTKQLLRDAGDLALDQSTPKKRFVEGRTSGSTGEPLVYYKTKAHQSWVIASQLHGWTWAGWRLGDRWIRVQFRGHLPLRARIEDWAFNCLYMPIDNLDEPFLRQFAERAARFDPVMIRGYAGATYVFAKFLLENGDERLRPRAVVSTGDTLYPHYREAIEAAFQCPVFDTYGGEGMAVANQCEEGSYHILPPVCVEVEPEGTEMQEERPGRLLLTSLTNLAMPMIRYDVGDIGIAGSGRCPCGRSWPFLTRIVGRETDIVVTPCGRRLVCHHFNNILREVNGVEQFQVLQHEPSRIVLRLVTTDLYSKGADEPSIARSIVRLGGERLCVEIEYVDAIPVPPSGKRRYIISSVGETPGSSGGRAR